MFQNKKSWLSGIVIFLIIIQSLSNWVFYGIDKVAAAGPVEETKLVAVFVEKNIYEDIKNNLQWYTLQYIQSRFARTKALVFPVDTSTISAIDIQKILTNLYFWGEKDTPSSLIGTVLIGKIPLPVIKNEQNIFPSIIPYTDLEKPGFTYDNTSSYFVPSSSSVDDKQELFHGLIKFDKTEQYNSYFAKLKTYIQNPKSFADRKFRYEDFQKLQDTFTDQNLPLYVQSQVNDEDIQYHRYSAWLFDLVQGNNTQDALSTLQNAGWDISNSSASSEDYPTSFNNESQAFTNALQSWKSNLAQQAVAWQNALNNIGWGDKIPTLLLWQSINQQTKNYQSLFSAEYWNTIKEEIAKWWRWTDLDIGSHITKTTLSDAIGSKILFETNSVLEKALDKKIDEKWYALNIPIPVVREEYWCNGNNPVWPSGTIFGITSPVPPTTPFLKNKQEVFYFWKNAWDITRADQTTRYRWTFWNKTTAEEIKASSIPYTGSSVWVSMWFTAQQVIASKWYNTLKAKDDANNYQPNRDSCVWDVSFENYVKSFWWWHTPVNMDWTTLGLKTNDRQFAFNPTYNRNIWGSLFDIWGASLASGNTAWTTALAAQSFGVFLQVAYTKQIGFALTPSFVRRNYDWCMPKNPIPVWWYNFFNVIQNPNGRDIQVASPTANGWAWSYNSDPVCKERLVYKTISSIVKHTSPTADELTGMNITTPSRPIDPKRYISFKGLGGQTISLDYPNIYWVEVYKNTNGILELKSPEEIKTTIVNYLEGIVDKYNSVLSNENNNIQSYLSGNAVWFALLATKDTKASPQWRQYEQLPRDFYTKLLWDNILNQVADILYVKNSAWQKIIPQNTVWWLFDYLENNIDIQDKMNAVLARQITVWKKTIWTNTTWYEAAYIRSFAVDSVWAKIGKNNIPTIIQQADTKRNTTKQALTTATQSITDAQEQVNDAACGVWWDGTVPILKWPSALSCWWKNLRKTALTDAVKISYKNAQWPVYPLGQFKDVLQESYDDYANYVENTLGIDSVTQSEIASVRLELPSQKMIRGSQIPLSISVKNKDNQYVDSLLFPIEITTSTWEFFTPGQAIPRIETTNPQEAFILDTSSVWPSVNKITIVASGSNPSFSDTKEIILVDWTLRTLVNNQQINTLNITLSNSGYVSRTAGIPSIREDQLPVLWLRLSDTSGGPISSAATIVSENWLIQPCLLTTKKELTAIWQITSKQCKTQELWTLTWWSADIKLLPNMKAGKDIIHISVPWLPDRTIEVIINPAPAYKVEVNHDLTQTADSNNMYARFAAQDIWWNIITTPQNIQYTLIGNITNTNNQKQWTITTNGTWNTLPIRFGEQWGVSYIYATLAWIASDAQQPWYLRHEIPNTIFPQYELNIVYLTLDGKDWWNPLNNNLSDMISSSPKLLSITTNLYNPQEQYPILWLIDNQWNILTGGDTTQTTLTIQDKKIFAGNTQIGYLNGEAPYTTSNIIIENTAYDIQNSWAWWSTSSSALAIIQKNTTTIDDSEDPAFWALRSYAWWLTVWESQKNSYAMEKINYWDPFLQHADATTPLQNTQTQVTLFQDDKKTIKKVMELDIDNDTRKDMVILYDDDTIRFMKQYGWTPPYRQLGNLMSVADGVQDMWIWDADGNSLNDIFIKTKKNTLRVYKNQNWSFDVNGLPVCLDVPSWDTNVSGIWDLFVADMNRDSRTDIITNDSRGQVRIFYWWWANGQWYYISSNPNWCDSEWQNRQRNNVRTVATFWLNLQQNTPIYDDSLIHWKWLTLPADTDTTTDPDDAPVPSNIANALPNPENPASLNIQNLITAWLSDTVRYTATPYDRLPSYESNTLENIAYIPARYLTGNDTIESYKTFAYGSWWTIIVTVHLRAKSATTATYIEQLRWPWNIKQNNDNSIEWFNRGSLPTISTIDWEIGDWFQFAIDNIPLQAWQQISFSYPVTYIPTQTVRIDVTDTNNDNWLDITTTPLDGCSPYSYTYRSEEGQNYTTVQNTGTNTLWEQLQLLQTWVKSTMWSIQSGIQTAQNDPSINLPSLNGILEQWDQNGTVLENILNDNAQVNANFNIDLDNLVGINTQEVEQTINKVLQWACQWFWGWGGGNLPVPFNMAFLSPGTFNVFGCKAWNDKWLPTFFFPWTLQTPAWPIPIPYGQKGPGDGFYWVGWGTYPSMIRIYVSPTLTMSVGTAICFGPYSAWINLPSPIKHIAGNCIVIAWKAKSWWGNGNNSWQPTIQNWSNNNWWNNNNTTNNTASQNTCRTPLANPARPISPVGMTMSIKDVKLSNFDPTILFTNPSAWTPWWAGWIQGQSVSDGTYLWIIDINTVPYATQRGQDSINKEQLKAGKPIKLEIQWWNVKWLIKCVINKWLDNQVRYIVNNLTNMSINIYLPDVTQLLQWFKNVRLDELNAIGDEFKKWGWNTLGKKWLPADKTPAWQALKNLTNMWKWDVSDIWSVVNNPFDSLSSWFEQVPLIKVNTQNVTVQIPFLYSEDIIRYESQLTTYGKEIEKSVQEWERMIQDLTWLCKKQETQALQEACNAQLSYYISIKDKVAQLQRSVKQNIQTLQAYKRFPQELQQRLTVSQRYMTEVSDTVQWVSNDLTWWLNTNARRFEKYVDTIITMVWAVKSWQAIISFSVDRKSKCGQCTVDNYDYYSCTLGLLCPTLPILAIPPFKLPNIYVDLSRVNLGMDVLLPKVQFVPKSIPLPALPTLPTPPTVNIDFTLGLGWGYTVNVPSIPQLPSPPRLPELPSFIPSIELNLPTLPPAPKVPRIAPAITSTLNVTSSIWQIMCIVKNGIWLVWEKWVKTRIEQLTQRTRSVEPFDSLSITKVQPPLRWFDLRVESYVNFSMNFGGLYNVIDQMTQKINKQTNQVLRKVEQDVATISTQTNNASQNLQNTVDQGNINIQWSIWLDGVRVNAIPASFVGGDVNTLANAALQNYKEPEQVDPNILKTDLFKELWAFKNSERWETYASTVQSIENTLNTDTTITPNYKDVHNATSALKTMIAQTSNSFENYKKSAQNYDSFLDTINTTALIDNTTTKGTISASLFKTTPEVHSIIENGENPMMSYFNLQEEITNWFVNALETRGPTELNMGVFTYNKLLQLFRTTKKDIQTVKWIINPNDQKANNIPTSQNSTLQSIIAPTVQAATSYSNTITASQPTTELWAIWWDDHSIYTNQNTYISRTNDWTKFTRYYAFDAIWWYKDFIDRVDENWYLNIFNTSFYVWDIAQPITSFVAAGQSNQTVTVNRKHGWQNIYILKLSNTIHSNHDNISHKDSPKKYILVYASDIDLTNTFIDIEWLPNKRLSDLQPDYFMDSIPFDADTTDISVPLDLEWDLRSYISIAPGSYTTHWSNMIIRTIWAWSHQETLWVQRRWDTSAPQATARIINRDNGTIVAEGTTLSIPRRGNYDLIIQWTDDGAVVKNTIANMENQDNIQEFAWYEGKLEKLPTNKDTITYYTTATDQANNIGNQNITIIYTDPTIRIDNIQQQADQSEIQSSLSQVFPNGYVRFYNQRDVQPNLLTWILWQSNTTTNFATQQQNTTVTGWVFYDAETISLFTPDQKRIARIEKENGKVTISPEWQSRLSLRLDTTQNVPILLFVDTQNGQTLFSLYLKSKQLLQVQWANNYTVQNMPSDTVWTFAWGQCVKDQWQQCIIYITNNGNIFMPDSVKARVWGSYNYNGGIEYTMTIDGIKATTIKFISESIGQ